MATATANPTYNMQLVNSPIKNQRYTKLMFLFSLPNLSGGTLTNATLQVYVYTGQSSSLSGVTIESSNANTSWNESTAYGTLDGYTLSAALDTTKTLNSSNAGSYQTWNVLGDASKGVQQAYGLGSLTTLVVINSLSLAAAAANGGSGANWDFGDTTVPNDITLEGRGTAHPPILTVTYTPAASRRRWIGIGGGSGQ